MLPGGSPAAAYLHLARTVCRRAERAVAALMHAEPTNPQVLIGSEDTARLETEIDLVNAGLPTLRSFVLPGGGMAAANLHLARTVCRRAERIMVALADKPGESVSAPSIKYVNRLSDYLFVASRHANRDGATDVLWVPGKNR